MNSNSFLKKSFLLTGLWVLVISGGLVYTFAAPPANNMYTRLILSSLATCLLAAGLKPYLAALLTAGLTSAGLAILKFYPILPEVSSKNLEKFNAAFALYQEQMWEYAVFIVLAHTLLAGLAAFLFAYLERRVAEASAGAAVVDKSEASETEKKEEKPLPLSYRNKVETQRLALMAIFVALGVIINTLRMGFFSFGGFPIILSGLYLGPIAGLAVGAVTDIIAYIIRPGGDFSILYTLTSALTGFLPIFLINLLTLLIPKFIAKKQVEDQPLDLRATCCSTLKNRLFITPQQTQSFLLLLLVIACGQFLTSVVMVPYFRSVVQGQGAFTVYFTRALSRQLFNVPLYAYLSVNILRRLYLLKK